MQPHPDFAGRAPPRSADLGLFRLAPLEPEAVDEDFTAVTQSVHVLRGLFGNDWPQGLTKAENQVDLAWHERDFTLHRSFSWIVRDLEGTYLGCAYVFPEPGERGRGQIYLWLADSPERLARLAAFKPILAEWLAPWLPLWGRYDWHVNDHSLR
ncbi:MAG: hypothetical protein ACK4GC_03350 [Paracoccaceae bacterium]